MCDAIIHAPKFRCGRSSITQVSLLCTNISLGNDKIVAIGCAAREATGHYFISILVGDGKSGEHGVARFEMAVGQGRCCCKTDVFLACVTGGICPDAIAPDFALGAAEQGAENAGGKGLLIDWTENQAVEMIEHIVHFSRLPAPPGGYRGEYEVFAEQVSRNAKQKRDQARIFERVTAQGIGNGNVPISHGIEQPGNAELRFFVEFQWVAKVVIDAAQNDIDGMQAIDGFEPGMRPSRTVRSSPCTRV